MCARAFELGGALHRLRLKKTQVFFNLRIKRFCIMTALRTLAMAFSLMSRRCAMRVGPKSTIINRNRAQSRCVEGHPLRIIGTVSCKHNLYNKTHLNTQTLKA